MTDASNAAAGGDRTDPTSELAPLLRACIAACAAGAAAIHLAMVPAHMSEWAAEGVAFVISGWIQLAIAALVLVHSRRWVMLTALVSSLVFIGAYLVTRTVGAPFGPQQGVTEPTAFVDLACVGLEAALALLSLLALARPRVTARWNHQAMVLASIVPVAALIFATTAVTSNSASNHGHGCPKGQIAAPKPSLAAGNSTATSTTTTIADDGHDHAGPTCVPENDNGYSLLGNGHHHAIVNNPLDPVTQAELDRQLAITREVAQQYPTVASALAAGYTKAGPYSPGLGAHYTKSGIKELNPSGVMTDDALRHPLSVLYNGNEPDSELVGFMYYSLSPVEPVGFVGTNDVWHSHTNICIKMTPGGGTDAPFGADLPITPEQCASVGGTLLKQTNWMVHVWTVPGYDNLDGGVFQEMNPRLACSDGTYYQLPPEEWADNLVNVCRSKAPGTPSDSRVL